MSIRSIRKYVVGVTTLTLLASIVGSGCQRPEGAAAPVATTSKPPAAAGDLPPVATNEMVEDLIYKQWSAFPPGTSVVRRTTTRNAKVKNPTISHTTIRLLEKTDDYLVIEEQTRTERSSGEVVQHEPMKFRYARMIPLPPNIRKEDWGKPQGIREQGTEEVEVLGKTLRCTYMKYTSATEVGEMQCTIWVSPEIPGGLVKSYSYVPTADETTTIEIEQVTIPR
ncbi:MAG: hypothetical protein NZU63_05770 [Gemmataceae bacterium]|nr:hypothetical protein [Gemmataceae bacterium]MDW8244246.1 hypothetical protein [Thermogemmata sp.]